ncbi:MAG: 6-bladed beta-propeller [Magnetococcales bacterium]|nr:6-bladed beta-propeller [Magnetococcales bacterium]
MALTLALGGCFEADLPRELRLGVEEPGLHLPVWPSPPDPPRYQYAGQLLGKENFVLTDAGKQTLRDREKSQKALMWLVGMDPDAEPVNRDSDQGLQRPHAGMVDTAGRILVTDAGQQGVVVFDRPAGRLRIWKQATAESGFAAPVGIAQGAKGEILVADADLGMVVRLSPEGVPVGTFGKGELVRPTGLARDATRGRVYVADSRAHDIKVFDDAGQLIKRFGSPGQMPGEFHAPTHLAFARDRLYVSDTLNARIQIFDPGGEFLLTFGQRGLVIGQMVRPKGVAVDSRGRIYVIEGEHDHLLIYDENGQFLLPIGGTGKDIGRFYLPSGIWTDAGNRVYIADMFNGRVMILREHGGAG